MEDNFDYDPLQWPPSIAIATQHYNCCKPGIDNPQGYFCRCCQRAEKLQNSKWPTRDIAKDFKNYGGGVPGYFYLLVFFIIVLLILTIVKVIYHIYVLQQACEILSHTKTPCTYVGSLKLCDSRLLFETLNSNQRQMQAVVLQILQVATYIILIVATIFIKIFLQLINKDKISLDEKLFSRFSLLIKNVPPYYQLDDLKEQLRMILPKLQVCEMFYLHKTFEYDSCFQRQFNLYFEIKKYQEMVNSDNCQQNITELTNREQEYLQIYDKLEACKDDLTKNTKKVIVVFNTIEEKELVHKRLKMNQLSKFVHYMSKMMDCKSDPISYYSQRLTEPQQINWKYIGQSSTRKQRVRIQTSAIGFGFMLLSFALFYFPMIKVDQQSIYDPNLGNVLGILISIAIIILAIVYKTIISKLTSRRKPSNKLAQSNFIVTTTVVFHLFFYLVTPAAFYLFVPNIPQNIKLGLFFTTVLVFCIINILTTAIDFEYRFFKTRKQKLMGQVSLASNFCQQRLHQELTHPSFPIESKLMQLFNIWSFNAFYVFQLPYLLILFMIVLILTYWIDKRNLYKHYKIQKYLSIQLELKVQKTYIVLFLLCVSFGYYISTVYEWQKYLIIVVVILALFTNFSLNYTYQKQKDSILKNNTDLKSAIQRCKSTEASALHLDLIQQQMKTSFLVPNFPQIKLSSVSLASTVYSYGYRQAYNLYLQQFKNKQLNNMLQQKYYAIKSQRGNKQKRKQSQMAGLTKQKQDLHQSLINIQESEAKISKTDSFKQKQAAPPQQYSPPKIDVSQAKMQVQQAQCDLPKASVSNQCTVKQISSQPQQQKIQQKIRIKQQDVQNSSVSKIA